MTTVYADVDVALGIIYRVTIDGADLGSFTSCEGLGIEVVLESREEGGNNTMVWQLPTRVKYPNIKLSRPLTKETESIAKWITKVIQGAGGTSGDVASKGRTGTIVAATADGTQIAAWSLQGIVPVRWTGPSMTPDGGSKVVTESLEIAHHGFTPGGP